MDYRSVELQSCRVRLGVTWNEGLKGLRRMDGRSCESLL